MNRFIVDFLGKESEYISVFSIYDTYNQKKFKAFYCTLKEEEMIFIDINM